MADSPRRGQIHWVDFDPVKGSEQGGRRPALVVSNNIANEYSSVAVVIPLTSKTPRKSYPQNVDLPEGRPLDQRSTVLCGQVRTVAQERLDGYRADLTPTQLAAVDRALAIALGLPKPPLSS